MSKMRKEYDPNKVTRRKHKPIIYIICYYQPHYNKPIFYFSCKIKEILA